MIENRRSGVFRFSHCTQTPISTHKPALVHSAHRGIGEKRTNISNCIIFSSTKEATKTSNVFLAFPFLFYFIYFFLYIAFALSCAFLVSGVQRTKKRCRIVENVMNEKEDIARMNFVFIGWHIWMIVRCCCDYLLCITTAHTKREKNVCARHSRVSII